MRDDFLFQLERMDCLIRAKATGTPTELAQRLNVSLRCVYNYLSILRRWGAPIKYCRMRGSYYYSTAGKFCFKFVYADKPETG